jgi:hypothetical protein
MNRTTNALTEQQEMTMSRLRISHRIMVVAGDADHTLLIDPAWQRAVLSLQLLILKRKPGKVAELIDELQELASQVE